MAKRTQKRREAIDYSIISENTGIVLIPITAINLAEFYTFFGKFLHQLFIE